MRKSIKKIGAIALAAALALSYAPISPFGQITAYAETVTDADVISATSGTSGSEDVAPTAAAELVYNGKKQNLLTAGTVDSTETKRYLVAVTETDVAPTKPTDSNTQYEVTSSSDWSDKVPQATDAGTYYVWQTLETRSVSDPEYTYSYSTATAISGVAIAAAEPTLTIAAISGAKVGAPTTITINVDGVEGGAGPAGTVALTAETVPSTGSATPLTLETIADDVEAGTEEVNPAALTIKDGVATYPWTPTAETAEGASITFTATYKAKTGEGAEKNYKNGETENKGVVKAENVTVAKGDIVAPSITAKLSDGETTVADGGEVALAHNGSAVTPATVTLTDGAADAAECTYAWSLACNDQGTAYTGGDTPDALEDSQADKDVVLTLNEAGTVFVKCVKTRENYADATPVYFSVKGVVTPTVTVTKTDPASVTTTSDIKITVDTGIAALADATVAVKVYKKADEGDTYSNTPETITISAPEAAAMKLDSAGKLENITFKIPATGTYKVVATVTPTTEQQTAGYVASAEGATAADITVSGTSISTATIKNNAGANDAEKSAGTTTYAPSGLAIPTLTVTLANGETVLNAGTDYDLWTQYGADEETANSASAVEGTTIANAGVYLVFAKGKGIYQDMTSTSYKYTVSKADDTIDLSSLPASFNYGAFTKYANVKSTGDQAVTFTYKKFNETPASTPEANSETYNAASGLGTEINDSGAVTTLDAGTYIAKATTAASDNYNAADAYKIFTISPKDVTFTAHTDSDCATSPVTSFDVTSTAGAKFYINTGVAGMTSNDGSIQFFAASTDGEPLSTITAANINTGKSTVTIARNDIATIFGGATEKVVYAQFTKGTSGNYATSEARTPITLKMKTAITTEMIKFYSTADTELASPMAATAEYNLNTTYKVAVKDGTTDITSLLGIVVEQFEEYGTAVGPNTVTTIQNAGKYRIKSVTGNDTYTCQLTTSELNAIALTITPASALPDSAAVIIEPLGDNIPYGTKVIANVSSNTDWYEIQAKKEGDADFAIFGDGKHGASSTTLAPGTWTFTLAGSGKNYSTEAKLPSNKQVEITIVKADNTVSITAPAASVVYGTTIEPAATDTNDVTGDIAYSYQTCAEDQSGKTAEELKAAFTSGSDTKPKAKGFYIVKATSPESTNYKLGEAYKAFAITMATPDKVTLPATTLKHTTESPATGTISLGTLPAITSGTTEILKEDSLNVGTLAGIDVANSSYTGGTLTLKFKALQGTESLGTGTVSFTLTDADGDYEIPYEVEVTLTDSSIYTVTWSETNYTYDGTAKELPTPTILKDGAASGITVATSSTEGYVVTCTAVAPDELVSGKPVNAGTYKATVKLVNANQTEKSATWKTEEMKTTTFEIKPYVPTLETWAYGDPHVGISSDANIALRLPDNGELPKGKVAVYEIDGENKILIGRSTADPEPSTYNSNKNAVFTVNVTPNKAISSGSWKVQYEEAESDNYSSSDFLTATGITVGAGEAKITLTDISTTKTSAKFKFAGTDGDITYAVTTSDSVVPSEFETSAKKADVEVEVTNTTGTSGAALTANTTYYVWAKSEAGDNYAAATVGTAPVGSFKTKANQSGGGGGSTTPSEPSGGDSGSGSGGGSTTPGKTETTTNPDGSTTETTTNPDGSKEEKTTEPDGTVVDTVTDKDGNTSTTTTNPDGSEVTESKSTEKEGTKETTTVTTVETDAEGNVTSSTETVTTTDEATGETTSKTTTTDETGTTEEVSTTKIENGLKVTEETVTQTDADGKVTYEKESTETYNPSTGYTTTESTTTMADGTKIEASTMESPTGENASSVTTTTNPDGSTEVVVMEKVNADGVQSESLSTTKTETDGSSVTESAEKVVDSNTGITTETETKVEVAANGDVTSQATEEKSLPSNVKVTTTNSTYTPAGGETQASTTISLSDPVVGQVDDVASGVVEGGQVYRLYNPNSGEHMFTRNAGEAAALAALGWNNETPADGDAAITVDDPDAAPVYRVYNPNEGKHHFTKDAEEAKFLDSIGWNMEGIAFFVYDAESGAGNPEYRVYNPNTGDHHWTSDAAEKDALVALGWNDEGVAWNVK